MSSLIVIGLIIWGMIALIRSAKQRKAEKRRAAQIARINAENAKRKAEIERMKANAKAEVARMVALEKEQMRQAKEQERQAAMLAKHEEQIAKLEFRMEQANRDIEFLNIRLDDLLESLDAATNEAQSYHNSGDAVKEERAKRKIVSLQNQIHTTESKLNKAKFDRELSERKMA